MFRKLERLPRLLVIAAVLAASAFAGPLPLPSPEATSSITARDLKKHLSFLASEELGGRYTLSSSNLIAARYLASQLQYYGFRGGAPGGSFFQPVPLFFRHIDFAASQLVVDSAGARKVFRFPDEFIEQEPAALKGSGGLVFVGYGISTPENHYDDYAHVDVKGKIAVSIFGRPAALQRVRLPDSESGAEAASAHGAVAEILITSPQFIAAWPQLMEGLNDQDPILPPNPPQSPHGFPLIIAGKNLINTLAGLIGKDAAALQLPAGKTFEPAQVSGSAEIRVKITMQTAAPAQNVIGILDGSDPALKDQFVLFSAHYDHLKTEDGHIYPGADDDGSGTVSVLEIAKACAIARPKRSILVVFHTGEELGLLGSEYNTDYSPAIPLNEIVADLNIDMIGRSRPQGDADPRDAHLTDKRTLYIIGADKLSTELNKISQQTDADTENFRFDYTYNDDSNPERFYWRSDHYNYAKHGIPIIFYFTGVHADYHEPTDTVEKIDFDKMERIARLVFATGWRIANLDHRLAVDKRVE